MHIHYTSYISPATYATDSPLQGFSFWLRLFRCVTKTLDKGRLLCYNSNTSNITKETTQWLQTTRIALYHGSIICPIMSMCALYNAKQQRATCLYYWMLSGNERRIQGITEAIQRMIYLLVFWICWTVRLDGITELTTEEWRNLVK